MAKKRQVTLSDIAAALGVATMTVSRVVNRTGYVSEETREKVLQAVKEMNYRPNGLARNLKRQRTETVVRWLHEEVAQLTSRLNDVTNGLSAPLMRRLRPR